MRMMQILKSFLIANLLVLVLASWCVADGYPTEASPPDAYQKKLMDAAVVIYQRMYGSLPTECLDRMQSVMIAVVPDEHFHDYCHHEQAVACYKWRLDLIVLQQSVIAAGDAGNAWLSEGHTIIHEFSHFLGSCAWNDSDVKHRNPALFMNAERGNVKTSIEHHGIDFLNGTNMWTRSGY